MLNIEALRDELKVVSKEVKNVIKDRTTMSIIKVHHKGRILNLSCGIILLK